MDKAEGTVFTNWTIGPFNEYYETVYGQDFGFSVDSTTLCKISVDAKSKRLWVKELFVRAGLSTTQIANLNRRHAGEELIICDNSEPRLISELKNNHKINIRPTIKKSGSILSGIALMQDYEIIVDPDSENIIKELNNYVWHARNEKPVDKWNHCLDGIRYALQHIDANSSKGVYVIR